MRSVDVGDDNEVVVERDQSERHKDIVLEAFDTLFNKRDYATAEKFWSEDYVQHSSRIPPGRDGLFEVIKSRPPEFAYEPELIMAENDLVMLWVASAVTEPASPGSS